MNNKTIIGFGFRMIRRIMQISLDLCYPPIPHPHPPIGLRDAADDTLFDLHNSLDHNKPHTIISK